MRHKHKQPSVKWRNKASLPKKGTFNRRIIGSITEPYVVDGMTRQREFTFHATKGFRSNRVA